jgi:hypothetical protein
MSVQHERLVLRVSSVPHPSRKLAEMVQFTGREELTLGTALKRKAEAERNYAVELPQVDAPNFEAAKAHPHAPTEVVGL